MSEKEPQLVGHKYMKIRFVIPGLWTGGGPRNIYTLTANLAERGHDVAVLDLCLSLHGFLEPTTPKNANVKYLWRPLALANQAAYVASGKTEWMIPVQLLAHTSSLLTSAESAIYIATSWRTAFPVSKVSRMIGRSSMYFVQAYESTFSNGSIYKCFANKTYFWKSIRFTQSAWLARFLEENYGAETHYVGMGIDHDVFHPVKIAQQQSKIVTIARTDPNKGFHTFLKAMKYLYKMQNDFEVVIIGEAAAVNPEKMDIPYTYGGWITNDKELANLYQGSIFVNTGVHEALPMPPLEAMACGATVVMTDTEGAREYTVDGQNCLLAPVGDAKALAHQICEALSNFSLREKLSKNAVATASRYRWETVTTKFEEIIKKEGLE